MNLVDSSGWLEYFADSDNSDFFTPVIEDSTDLLLSVINIYEVFKRILQQRDENSALQAVAVMEQGLVIDLSSELALRAADISLKHKLPMADAMIYATARSMDAVLWTQDADFKDMDKVRYIEK